MEKINDEAVSQRRGHTVAQYLLTITTEKGTNTAVLVSIR